MTKLYLALLTILNLPIFFVFTSGSLHPVNDAREMVSRHANDFRGAISIYMAGKSEKLSKKRQSSGRDKESVHVTLHETTSENSIRYKERNTINDKLAAMKSIPPLPLRSMATDPRNMNGKALPHRYLPIIPNMIEQRMINEYAQPSVAPPSPKVPGSTHIDMKSPNEQAKRRQKEILNTEIAILVTLLIFMLLFAYSVYFCKQWKDQNRTKKSYIDWTKPTITINASGTPVTASAPGTPGALGAAPSAGYTGARPRVTFSLPDAAGGLSAPSAGEAASRWAGATVAPV